MNYSEPHPDSSDWIALVRGEHSWLAAGRLRRHLKHCPYCAVELKEITSMLAVVKPKEPIVSKALATKTWGALPAGGTTRRKLRLLGFVGGVALVAGATLFFAMPGGPLQPIPSFASVEESMGKVHTATWRVHITIQNQEVKSAYKTYFEQTYWADLKQRKIARLFSTGKEIREDKHQIRLFKAKGSSDMYSIGDRSSKFDASDGDIWVDKTIYFYNSGNNNDRELGSGNWKSDRIRERGMDYIRYRRYSVKKHYFPYKTISRILETVFVDPKTKLIVRRESRHVYTNSSGSGRNESVWIEDGFRYNLAPPAGAFDITPPLGKLFRLRDYRLREVSEQDKKILEQQARKAMQAWNQKDTKSFGDLFDFYATGQLNSFRVRNNPDSVKASFWRKTWTEHLQKREPYLEYLSYDKPFFHYDFGRMRLYTRTSTSEAFPPPIPMDEVTVGGTATVRLRREPNRVQKRLVTFKFVKRHGQWKLVWIDSQPMPQKAVVKK
ncbi:hypothetical protein [Armatimonas sp.]|uniref:hypothetical protein n=1 Tax=Armatimonas sp. TaxID=1872638 RepID=UPI00286CE8D8|nr:hypothetical protein [Armatimonas sp.]